MLSFLLAFTAVVAYLAYFRWFHTLSKFPGPFWASQTDLWRVYQLCTRRMPETLLKLHEKYGPVVRIGPNELSFQSSEALATIYKSGRTMIKSNFYDGFTAFIPNLFGTRDEEFHAKRRRQMAHSFSVASLSQMEFIFDRHINALLQRIDKNGDETFDLKALIAYYTYDLMGELIFNADFGSQKAQRPEELPPINNHVFLGCLFGMMPSLLPYSMQYAGRIPWPWLQNLLQSRRQLRDKTSKHVSNELAKDRSGQRHNILARLISAKDPETGEMLSDDEINSEAFAFLVAGGHTTSSSLTLLFYHLLHHPEVAEKLTKEVVDVLPTNSFEQTLPAYSGLEAQLPFATVCIRENFRVTPIFTMPLPRTVTQPDGVMIDGLRIPQGVNVSMVNHVLHHDPSLWGEDHTEFRPERWLDGPKSLSPNNISPFGTGHRGCIGRNIAMMSIVKVLTTVWRRFELEAVDPHEELFIESVGIGEKKGPLLVRAKLRAE